MLHRLRRRRIVRVRQHDTTDCGAACLHAIGCHYGKRIPIARIRELACTDQRGSNVLGLVTAAVRMGLTARGVRGAPASLAAVPMPAIAHVEVAGGRHHYVVVHQAGRRGVVLMDPADGRVHRVPLAEFLQRWTGVLVILLPTTVAAADGGEPGTAGLRLWSLVRPHRTLLAQALLGAAFHTLLGLSTAIYVQKIVDHAVPDGNQNLLNLLGLVMLVVIGVQILIGWVRGRITLVTGQRIDAALLGGYHRHLLQLPQRFFDTRRVGEITSRFNDAVKIRAFVNDAALSLVVSALVLLMSIGLMATYSPDLAIVAMAGMPLYGLVYVVGNRLNRAAQRELMERAADVEAELVEGLQAVSDIRAFGAQWWAGSRLEARLVRLLRAVHRSGLNAIGIGGAVELITRLVTIALLWIGAGQVIRGAVTTGELMSFYALAGYLTGPITTLIGANRTVQDALIAADRLFEIMDLEREEPERRPPLPVGTPPAIRFEHVTVRYGTSRPVLDGLTMQMAAGTMTALVGESGSGKSTIAAVLMGFYPVSAGRLTIGGHDVRHFSRASLRERIGIVPQRVTLLSATVVENIALGDPDPDTARVMEVCERLGITGFIGRLAEGPHTVIGEDGVGLSGGERQRLAIARVLYRDPPIVVLDEATSSLDAASESIVGGVVAEMRARGRTIVVISHQLRAITGADRIAVLAKGRIQEEGTHVELLGRRGAYHELWMKQHPGVTVGVTEPAEAPRPEGSRPEGSRPEGSRPEGPRPATLHRAGRGEAAWIRSIVG